MAKRLSGVVPAVFILSGLVLLAQGAPQCPQSLASLMPAGSEEVKRPSFTVHLLGVAHNDTTAINIEIGGHMSAEAAKAAASEVLGKFAKADFNTLDK